MKEFRKTKDGLFICEECGKICKNKQGLGTHIHYNHTNKEYYDKWLKENHEGICKICGKETKFIGIKAHGYSNYCSKKCISHQTKENNIKKYGVKCTLNTPTSIKKKKATWTKNYGVDNPSKSAKIKKQKEQVSLKKFGVKNPAQHILIHKKIHKIRSKKFRDSALYYQGSFELDFLEKYYDKFPDIQRGPSFHYKFGGNDKIYFSDFYIPSKNLIIEIKNSYLYKRDKEIIFQKETAVKEKNYKYIIIIDKDYSKLNKL